MRTLLYYWIDRADTWVLRHPRTPAFIRQPVYGAWCWMMGRGTWTAVGEDCYAWARPEDWKADDE